MDHDFISGPRDYHRADAPLVCRRCDRTEEEHDTAALRGRAGLADESEVSRDQ